MPPNHAVAGALVVLDLSLSAGQFAAQFAPVPILAPILGAVQGIIEACAKVQSNRVEARQLQERCRYLVLALNDQSDTLSEPKMIQVVTGCTTQMEEVLNVIIPYARLTRWAWASFVQQRAISDAIRKCHTKIDDCCREFQIRSHIQLHQWQNDFKVAQEYDHAEVLTKLMEINEDNAETQQMIVGLGTQVGTLLELLQTRLGDSQPDSEEYHALERRLYHVQKKSGELPPGTDLKAGEAKRLGKFPVGGNAAFDIWEGIWLGKEKVALKTIRGVHVSPETQKRFQREVKIWREVWALDRGRYILPFYGACFEDGPYPYMVSPWMNNGDVTQYLMKYPTANRRNIIKGIASGLSLLHNLKPKPIAHGDVKAANILIDDSGQPLLADFGLSKILEDITGVPFTQSKGVSESYRWFAPELCSAPGVISTYSDVFAYGMTVVEIMTDQPPFSHIKRTTEVLIEMQKGERPRKPTDEGTRARGLDDHLWEVITSCWTELPGIRPSIDGVLAQL